MESLNQLAETLAERAGRQFDIPFQEEMKGLVGIWRSRLLRDSLERRKGDRMYFRQYLEVPLVQVNVSELPGFPDRPVWRTETELPDPVRSNNIAFDYVGSPDKLSQIQLFTEQHEVIPALNARYTGSRPKALWLNKFIYVWNWRGPWLGVSSVYDNPEELAKFRCNCGEDICFDHDKPYPVSGDLQQRIIQAILATELRITLQPETKVVPVNPADND